jgi:hypothetical protein
MATTKLEPKVSGPALGAGISHEWSVKVAVANRRSSPEPPLAHCATKVSYASHADHWLEIRLNFPIQRGRRML